jgi:hypothetical protein
MTMNIRALEQNIVNKHSKEYKEYVKERRKQSYLSNDEQRRQMQRVQKQVNRDIKRANKALASAKKEYENADRLYGKSRNEKESSRIRDLETKVDNLKEYVSTLTGIKAGLAQSNTMGSTGDKVYNSASSRLSVMDRYISAFGSPTNSSINEAARFKNEIIEEISKEGVSKYYDFGDAESFRKNFEAKYGDFDFEGYFENTLAYQELYEDYINAIRAFDSDTAKRIAKKMVVAYNDYYNEYTNVRGLGADW